MSNPATAGRLADRRLWLATAAAAIAAGAVAGYAWRRPTGHPSNEAAVQALWAMSFEQIDGQALRMATYRGKPLLLNFWATWCPPCVKEMPLLDRFQQRETTWQVLGLAIDQATPVKQYLQRVPVGFSVALAGADGVQLGRVLGNSGGQLPYTAVFNGAGALVDHHLGAVDEEMLANWVATVR